jgi:hypothetical protein
MIKVTVYISSSNPRLPLIEELIQVTNRARSYLDGFIAIDKLHLLRSTGIPFDIERNESDNIVAEASDSTLAEDLKGTMIRALKWISQDEIVLSDPLQEASKISALQNVRAYVPSKLTWKTTAPCYEYDLTVFNEESKLRFLSWLDSQPGIQATYSYELFIRVELEKIELLQLLLDNDDVSRVSPYSAITLC